MGSRASADTSTVRPTVLLFDIDGTLVTTPGAGRRALERAFVARFGRTGVLHGMHFGGMTDRALVRAGLAVVGEPAVDATIDAILADYLPALEDELDRAVGFGLQPGVHATLAAVRARAGVAIGLGTGNIRPGAEAKLTRVGIAEHFAFGGFGCDHEERPALLHIGALRGAATLGVGLEHCRVVVIGDTPRDVAAAHAIGAESIGVGTCGFTPAALRASGATYAFDTLEAPDVVTALLGSARA